MKDRSRKNGFTLVELVVALAVASILAGAIFSFYVSSHRNYQKEQARVVEAQSIRTVGNHLDNVFRQSSQYLKIHQDSNHCVIINDLRKEYDDVNDVYNPVQIATYCSDGEVLVVNDVMIFDMIQEIDFHTEVKEINDENGVLINSFITKVEIQIQGGLGSFYEKVFVLRHQE